jgi:DNA-binding PadR family transcriptional regulator
MLAVRSWTGYELTQQVRRSLRFIWSTSEGHLYREQRHLVSLGWATVEDEPTGRRSRKRYTITDAGRTALSAWLQSEPEEPHLHIEGVLRAFYADQGSPDDLAASLRSTATSARAMLDELTSFASEYLEPGGPQEMLETSAGATSVEPLVFKGRPVYPDRLTAVSIAVDLTSQLLELVDEFSSTTSNEVAGWTSTSDPSLAAGTRARLERIAARTTRTGGEDAPPTSG